MRSFPATPDSDEPHRVREGASQAVVCSAGRAAAVADELEPLSGFRYDERHPGPGRLAVLPAWHRSGGGAGLLDATRLALRKRELIEAGESVSLSGPAARDSGVPETAAKAGVHLVVVPVPDKATLQPAELTSRFDSKGEWRDTGQRRLPRFLDELRSSGVDVFDPSPKQLDSRRATAIPATGHALDAGMDGNRGARPGGVICGRGFRRCGTSTRPWSVEERQVSRVGDIVDMLKLPAEQRVISCRRRVTIHRVLDPRDARAWQPSPEADVLVLGDSFSNIYCTIGNGVGRLGGLPRPACAILAT